VIRSPAVPTVTVRLHGVFRELGGGTGKVTLDAHTVGEALDRLPERLPALRERIRNEHGRIRDHLNVFHNEERVQGPEAEAAALREGDTVHLIPAVSGGRF